MYTRSTKQLHLAVLQRLFRLKMLAACIVKLCCTSISWWLDITRKITRWWLSHLTRQSACAKEYRHTDTRKHLLRSVLVCFRVRLLLFPPPNAYRTRCTHDMFWIKKQKMCTRSTKQLHLAVIKRSFCLKMVAAYIVKPCSTDISWWEQRSNCI